MLQNIRMYLVKVLFFREENMGLQFTKIKKEAIFNEDFEMFVKNNEIDFSNGKTVVLYAPNGVGKSSFCKVLSGFGEFNLNYDNTSYDQTNCDLFHIINDQNSRNIIKGSAKDFLLGDNIAREFELKEWLDDKFDAIFESIKERLKNEMGISKKSDIKISWMPNLIQKVVEKIANSRSKVGDIDWEKFLEIVETLIPEIIGDFDSAKFSFIIANGKIVNELLNIRNITKNMEINKIEENNDAISILEKYRHKEDCIVCDNNGINSIDLLEHKKSNKESIISNMDNETKKLLEEILNNLSEVDPFCIKTILTNSILDGDTSRMHKLQGELELYKKTLVHSVESILISSVSEELANKNIEYKLMLANPLNFTDEDILFIKEFIEKSIDKSIVLERDNNRIKLILDSSDFLEVERENLKLSSGEQNFISLAFELLKAKNTSKKIIIVDDPISSFDSIYKNKIVYAIAKILKSKNIIVLTHNTDLLRLVEVQSGSGINLYLFNNFENQENGFIKVADQEKEILIYIPKLLEFLRSSEIDGFIKNEKMLIYSLIPFMRGYADYIGENTTKSLLTKLMHGYNNESINVTAIYNAIFCKNLANKYNICVTDILNVNIDELSEIIDRANYSILNRVLINNFVYLYLRLKTERVLVTKYNINTSKYDQLSAIINQAFKGTDVSAQKNRVLFFAKKTLLNEFNHFDGNMSIFQPALDISEAILKKEKEEILSILSQLESN